MTTAREIVARAREESRDKSDLGVLLYQAIAWPSEVCGTALMDENLHDWQARAILAALTAAGFRIVGPDDLDEKTVEKCAAELEKPRKFIDGTEVALPSALSCAAALRALKEKQG